MTTTTTPPPPPPSADTPPKLDLPPDPAAAADTPPSKRGPGRPAGSKTGASSTKGPGRPTNSDKLAADLTATLSTIGVAVSLRDMVDGYAITNGSPALASALVKLSEQNAALRNLLTKLTQAGAYGELVKATALIAIPILANHGVVPLDVLPFILGADEAATMGQMIAVTQMAKKAGAGPLADNVVNFTGNGNGAPPPAR